ncbi:MAG: glycosyltransferase family 39 protein [Myxococcota bacterium]|nr:glycosyltransferase family 39 protein [Myxococcota bacterium]
MRPTLRAIRASGQPVLRELTADRQLVRWLGWFACIQLLCSLWDIPSSFGWENDGIAPRDFFGGIANNILPGHAHRYPLMHYLLVGICSLPFLLLALITASSWTAIGIKAAVLSVPTMTAVSVVAKSLTIGLGCMAILAVATICRRGYGTRAGRYCALLLMTCMTFTYYARTSNLDVPSMAWALLGIERLSAYVQSTDRRDMYWSAAFCAAAVSTKDPAYGLLVLPLAFVCLIAPWWNITIDWKSHLSHLGRAAGVGILAYGVLSGAFLNPTGFLARIDLLTGTNSQDWATYTNDWDGLKRNILNITTRQWDAFWPPAITSFTWVAVLWGLWKSPLGGRRLAVHRLLPLLSVLSAISLFTLVVRRDDHRFIMPLCFGLAFYGGALTATIIERTTERYRRLLLAGAIAGLVICAVNNLRLIATQWTDPRNDVETYLQTLPAGSVVETYGLVVYQPRFDASDDSQYRLQRVGKKPPQKRNPLAPTELEAPYMKYAERSPTALVITDGFASRFRTEDLSSGRIASVVVSTYQTDVDATEFFNRAFKDDLPGYSLALNAGSKFPSWLESIGFTPVSIHGSTGRTVRVFRQSTRSTSP